MSIMEDNEKQIEEMARDIAKKDCHLFENCPKEHKHNCISQEPKIMIESSKNYITIATWLISEGWIKPNKDSVVLLREEYERLLKIKEEASIKEINYFSNLSKLQKELEQVEKERDSAIDNCDRKGKEMAEKYNDKLVAIIQHLFDIGQIDFKTKIELLKENEKILKQFGVEIKE